MKLNRAVFKVGRLTPWQWLSLTIRAGALPGVLWTGWSLWKVPTVAVNQLPENGHPLLTWWATVVPHTVAYTMPLLVVTAAGITWSLVQDYQQKVDPTRTPPTPVARVARVLVYGVSTSVWAHLWRPTGGDVLLNFRGFTIQRLWSVAEKKARFYQAYQQELTRLAEQTPGTTFDQVAHLTAAVAVDEVALVTQLPATVTATAVAAAQADWTAWTSLPPTPPPAWTTVVVDCLSNHWVTALTVAAVAAGVCWWWTRPDRGHPPPPDLTDSGGQKDGDTEGDQPSAPPYHPPRSPTLPPTSSEDEALQYPPRPPRPPALPPTSSEDEEARPPADSEDEPGSRGLRSKPWWEHLNGSTDDDGAPTSSEDGGDTPLPPLPTRAPRGFWFTSYFPTVAQILEMVGVHIAPYDLPTPPPSPPTPSPFTTQQVLGLFRSQVAAPPALLNPDAPPDTPTMIVPAQETTPPPISEATLVPIGVPGSPSLTDQEQHQMRKNMFTTTAAWAETQQRLSHVEVETVQNQTTTTNVQGTLVEVQNDVTGLKLGATQTQDQVNHLQQKDTLFATQLHNTTTATVRVLDRLNTRAERLEASAIAQNNRLLALERLVVIQHTDIQTLQNQVTGRSLPTRRGRQP